MNLGLLFKSVGPAGLGGGIGVGGVAIYKNTTPETWKDFLQREGFDFVSDENGYKAIFYDHKDELSSINELKDNASEINSAHPKIKEWCEKELKTQYSVDDQKKKNLINLCSFSGINSQKGLLTYSSQTNWIDDKTSDKDEDYKTIFSIFKYLDTFVDWINEGKSETGKISKDSKTSEKYSLLRTKCLEELKKTHEGVSNKKRHEWVGWWCTSLSYSKVEDRIKAMDPSWTKPTTWSKIKEKWQNTERVTKEITGEDGAALDDSKFQQFCEKQLARKLSEDDVYQEKYLIVKAVCREI